MIATELSSAGKPGHWRMQIDHRMIEFWLDKDGLHCREIAVVVEGGMPVRHRDQVLSWTNAMAAAEGQKMLL
jgi:hypothetical protein